MVEHGKGRNIELACGHNERLFQVDAVVRRGTQQDLRADFAKILLGVLQVCGFRHFLDGEPAISPVRDGLTIGQRAHGTPFLP